MRFQFIAVTAGVTLGIVAGVTPLEAKVSVKPKASVAARGAGAAAT